jgi:hypothetical protein
LLVAAAVVTYGTWAAAYYSRLGLALAHYDARAHLVVARRILDSLCPGWQQIGCRSRLTPGTAPAHRRSPCQLQARRSRPGL